MSGTTAVNVAGLAAMIGGVYGFDPTGSVVLVALDPSTDQRTATVHCFARLDIPSGSDAYEFGAQMGSMLARQGVVAAVALVYPEQGQHVGGVVSTLVGQIESAGVTVPTRVEVRDGQYRRLGNWQWLPLPTDGPAVTTTRAQVVASMAAGPQALEVARAALALECAPSMSEAVRAWGRLLDLQQEPSTVDYASAAAACSDVTLRDGIATWAVPGSMEPEALPQQVQEALAALPSLPPWAGRQPEVTAALSQRVVALCQMMPSPLCPGPCTIAGMILWWLGDGTRARIALDRALGEDPGYRLAGLIASMIDLGIGPFGPVPAPGTVAAGRAVGQVRP